MTSARPAVLWRNIPNGPPKISIFLILEYWTWKVNVCAFYDRKIKKNSIAKVIRDVWRRYCG